jgi:two-component system cell cycle sensor histidine kinase/response regulator CckA
VDRSSGTQRGPLLRKSRRGLRDTVRETLVALVVSFLLGGFFAWVVELSHPATVLSLVIVYFAFRGGFWPGLAAALMTVAWSTYSTFHNFIPRFFPTEALQRLAAVIIAMPVLAWIVSRLRNHERQVERDLRVANESLRSFIDASPLSIHTLDTEGRIRSWNRAAEHIFGWTAAEVIGKQPPMILPESAEQYEALLERVLNGETIRDLKLSRRRKDDTVIIAGIAAAPLFESPDKVSGGIVLASDITSQELAEEALRRQATLLKSQAEALRASENTYRMLLEQASDGIFLVDTNGTFVTVNTRGCEMVDRSWEELRRLKPADVLADEDVDITGERMEELRHGRTLLSERRLKRADGSYLPVEVSSKLLPDGRLQAIVRDITQRRETEETLREREAELRQAQKMEAVGRLAGGVAHDFNNLLTAIQGHTQLLLEDVPGDDPMYGELQEISKAADRAASLTRQLLAFSRKQVLQPRMIDLNHIVADMQKMLVRLIGENISLEVKLEEHLASVRADPGQLQQVLLNLVVNGRDAMPDGGTLRIATKNALLDAAFTKLNPGSRVGSYASLSVCDTGTGMDAELLTHIFEPFFTTKAPGSGTGLGLSTVYGIVKQSDGYIAVSSDVNSGTTFTIYMPRVDGIEPEQPVLAARAAPEGSGATVLLVEDEESVRTLVEKVLERKGYRVLLAGNGREALELAAAYDDEIDLLITDVVMPEVGGRELARRIELDRPGIRILYMSGYSEEAVAQHGVLEPGTDFLEKPFTPEVLIERVRLILDGGR